MKLTKTDRRRIICEYVASVNEVDKIGVPPTLANKVVSRMLGVDFKLISKDLQNLVQQDSLYLKDGMLWFKDATFSVEKLEQNVEVVV